MMSVPFNAFCTSSQFLDLLKFLPKKRYEDQELKWEKIRMLSELLAIRTVNVREFLQDSPVQTVGLTAEICLDPLRKLFLTFVVRIASDSNNKISKNLYKEKKIRINHNVSQCIGLTVRLLTRSSQQRTMWWVVLKVFYSLGSSTTCFSSSISNFALIVGLYFASI